jgi:GT2 family glycosyltransferase
MSIAIIIPARDAERVLPATLAALGDAPEVVVVDNGSRDATAAAAVAHGARVVHEPRPSRAIARNTGAWATTAERLAFLDADCVPQPGWLAALDRCLDEHALVGGRVIVRTGTPPNTVERFDAAWRFRQDRTIAEQGWAVTANLGVHASLFRDLGGFDERYRHSGEDVDFCLRAGDAGTPPTYCADAAVVHEAESRVGAVVRRGLRQGHAGAQLHAFTGGRMGRDDWKHPRPMLFGPYALERFGLDDPSLTWLARADYAARVAGSAWAALRRAR